MSEPGRPDQPDQPDQNDQPDQKEGALWPWPLRALALGRAVFSLAAYVALTSCSGARSGANQTPAPAQQAQQVQQIPLAPPDLAPAALRLPAPAPAPADDPRFWPATKSAPMHLLDRPGPGSGSLQQQAPQQQASPRNAR